MRRIRTALLSLPLVFSLGCGLFGRPLSGDPATEGTPIATVLSVDEAGSGPDSQPEPVQPLEPPDIPADFMELIERNVELSLWSEGEGLIAGLEYLAGQQPEDGAVDPAGILRLEASSLLWNARAYLQSGSDAAARQRIEELLQIVSPDIETLEAYSQPASSSQGGGMPLASPHSQEQCAKLAADGFPKGSAEVCWLHDSFNHADGTVRIYYPASWGPNGGDKQLMLQATRLAAEQAITTFSQYGALPSLNFVFGLVTKPPEEGMVTAADAIIGGTVPEDACIVTIYAVSEGINLENFKHLMAHETFHCFQWMHYGALMQEQARDWWVEGTAEYFADLAFPLVDLEQQWLPYFTSLSRYVSIVTMKYPAFVFFEYLGGRSDYGPAGVLALMGAMPPSGGEIAQAQALGQQPGMEAVWEQFALDFLDGKVREASGQAMEPPLMFTDSFALFVDGTHELKVTDYSLQRYRLAIGTGQGFHLKVSQADEGVLDWTKRPLEIGGWQALELDLPEGCDQFMAVVVRGRGQLSGERQATLDVVIDTPLVGTCDECIVGTWHLNKPSFAAYMENLIGTSLGTLFTVTDQVGTAAYTFGPQGELTMAFSPYTFHWLGVQFNEPFGNDIVTNSSLQFSGQATGSYVADGISALHTSTDLSGVGMELTIHLQGEEIYQGPPFEESFISAGVPPTTTYTCQGDVLSITAMSGGKLLGTVSYDRVTQP